MKKDKKETPEEKTPDWKDLPFGFYPPLTDWQEL